MNSESHNEILTQRNPEKKHQKLQITVSKSPTLNPPSSHIPQTTKNGYTSVGINAATNKV